MAFNKYQFETLILRPSLAAIGLLSDDAVRLMLGIAAQESLFGTYIVQAGMDYSGGVGIFQMQSATYYSAWDNKVEPYPILRGKIKSYIGYNDRPPIQRIASDLAFACIMARIQLTTFSELLPKYYDAPGQAAYWKKYWNTRLGAGTVDEFMMNYKKYVVG